MRLASLAVLALLGACAPARHDVLEPEPRFSLYVLGRAQDGGLPHFGCEQPCCADARASGRRETPASLGVHDRATGRLLLIEATPAIESQVALLHARSGETARGRQPVDAVLLSHAHIGHYLGLAQFGREVCASRDLPVFVTPRFAAYLRSHGPWRQLVELRQLELREVAPGSTFTPLEGLRVETVAVPHRDEFSDTVAFKLHGPRRSVLFVPDIDAWRRHPGLLEQLLDGVDVAYLDGTFYDGQELPERARAEIPHPTMVETMALLAASAAARPNQIRFIHLNHSNPALTGRVALPAGFRVAEVGERIDL